MRLKEGMSSCLNFGRRSGTSFELSVEVLRLLTIGLKNLRSWGLELDITTSNYMGERLTSIYEGGYEAEYCSLVYVLVEIGIVGRGEME